MRRNAIAVAHGLTVVSALIRQAMKLAGKLRLGSAGRLTDGGVEVAVDRSDDDDERLGRSESHDQLARHVVAAMVAIDVSQMHLHPGDLVARPAQRGFHSFFGVAQQGLRQFEAMASDVDEHFEISVTLQGRAIAQAHAHTSRATARLIGAVQTGSGTIRWMPR
jgi:hypothetical protein